MIATSLYRHFDGDGKLLYVGISNDAVRRFGQHRHGSDWAKHISRVDIERHDSREAAIEAERVAIIDEKPIWNIAGNPIADPDLRSTDDSRVALKLWVSPQKHAEIKKAAEDDRRSMTAWIMILIDKALEQASGAADKPKRR